MSLLDTTETNKQLENELDKIVMKELREHYYRADAEAFNISDVPRPIKIPP